MGQTNMSTARNEGNNSGSDGNVSSGSGGNKLHIQMLKRGGDGMKSDMNPFLNVLLVWFICKQICEYAQYIIDIQIALRRFGFVIWILYCIRIGVAVRNDGI